MGAAPPARGSTPAPRPSHNDYRYTLRRQPKLDFRSANEAELEGIKDSDVLAIAAQDGRVLVTHDRKTMPTEFGQFIASQTSSGVLILSQNLPISEAIDAIILVWEASTTEEWIGEVVRRLVALNSDR